jgi:HPt (histidine-containing phosphotransfer) domain-containing protein
MLPLFIKEVEQTLGDIEQSVKNHALDNLSERLHKLKGSMMLFQFSQAVEEVSQLELSLKSRDFAAMLNRVGQLKEALIQFKQAV